MKTIIPISTLVYIAEPFITSIIADIMITNVLEPDLRSIRNRCCDGITKITGKNHIFFDADINNAVHNTLRSQELFAQHGHVLIETIDEWVHSPFTHWEASKIRPLLNILKVASFSPILDTPIDVITDDELLDYHQEHQIHEGETA